MSYFEWDNRYDLGIDKMNTEHRGLISLMNQLYDLNTSGASHAKLKADLLELERRTVEHFDHEEKYQASINFPGLTQHKNIHASLLKQFGEHKTRFIAAGKGLDLEFFAFLKLWLSAHIAGIDRKYADHANSSKRAPV